MTAGARPALSVKRSAALVVCAHARDADDARLLLEVLGLVDEDGTTLLPDEAERPISYQELAAEVSTTRPPQPVRAPKDPREFVPAGLRNLPPPEPEKKAPMPTREQNQTRALLATLTDDLTARNVILPDDNDDAVVSRLPLEPAAPPPVRPAAAGPYVAALSVVELFVDRSYQRPLDQPRVNRMLKAWDPRMVGILDVSDRGPAANPRYAVVNGQHRWSAAGAAGVQYLACNVHEGLDVAGEARLMFELDRTTKKLSGWDKWRARRAAGDPTVLAVDEVAARHGLRVDDDPAAGSMRSYGTAEKLLKLGGEQLLDHALAVLRAAWGDASAGFQAPLLMGVGQLLHRHGTRIDSARLGRALAATRPEQLRSTATALREVDGGPLHELMARAIVGQYNRATSGPRLGGSR